MSKKQDKPQKPSKREATFPSSQTLFRVVGLSNTFEQTLSNVFRASNTTLNGEELAAAERIRQAQTPAQVVALSGQTRGVAQLAWTRRMSEFGAEALPAITRRLKSSQSIADEGERHIVVERLIGALRRLGPAGGQALLECFNNLDDYCQSLTCVTLGLLRVEQAADAVWRYYQRVKKTQREGDKYVIGALWGLIDLRHPQTDEAVTELLAGEQSYAEEYPFAARAGGKACVGLLIFRLSRALRGDESYDGERDDILMALAGIGQRLGPDGFRAVLREYSDDEKTVEAIADVATRRDAADVAQYFQMYYQSVDELLKRPDAPDPADSAQPVQPA